MSSFFPGDENANRGQIKANKNRNIYIYILKKKNKNGKNAARLNQRHRASGNRGPLRAAALLRELASRLGLSSRCGALLGVRSHAKQLTQPSEETANNWDLQGLAANVGKSLQVFLSLSFFFLASWVVARLLNATCAYRKPKQRHKYIQIHTEMLPVKLLTLGSRARPFAA